MKPSKRLIKQFMENTTLHGLPRVYKADSLLKKIIWVAIILISTGLICWQSTRLCMKYFAYEKTTNVNIISEQKIQFPTITLCPSPAIKPDLLKKITKRITGFESENYWDLMYKKTLNISVQHPNTSSTNLSGDELFMKVYLQWFSSIIPAYLSVGFRYFSNRIMDTFGAKVVRLAARSKDDLLLNCYSSFGHCSKIEFTETFHPKYWNCLRLTLHGNIRVGKEQGFRLALYLGDKITLSGKDPSILPGLRKTGEDGEDGESDRGIAVYVHQNGHSLLEPPVEVARPGEVTHVGISLTQYSRILPPHGQCLLSYFS